MDDNRAGRDPSQNLSSAGPGISVAETSDPQRPPRVLGFRDLVMFYVVTGISLRWIATAAAAGPSSVVIWIGAWLVFYIPLALSVIELSSRYPNEGGLYVWSKRAFGDFAGFMSAWTYWTCNLPYFPAVLYFAASNALFMRPHAWMHLSSDSTYYIVFSFVTLAVGAILNIIRLDGGKWVPNLGALAMLGPGAILIILGLVAWHPVRAGGAFLAAVARLPFVAGLDHFLPAIFGAVHPRWRTPWFALLMQAVFGMVFALLGQVGTSVKGAYDVLVSMGVITYFIPFLYLFAAMFKLQLGPAGEDVIRVPGGKPVALMVAIVGFCTTLLTIVLSLIPQPDEPNKLLAVIKIVGLSGLLVLVGAWIYWAGKKRALR